MGQDDVSRRVATAGGCLPAQKQTLSNGCYLSCVWPAVVVAGRRLEPVRRGREGRVGVLVPRGRAYMMFSTLPPRPKAQPTEASQAAQIPRHQSGSPALRGVEAPRPPLFIYSQAGPVSIIIFHFFLFFLVRVAFDCGQVAPAPNRISLVTASLLLLPRPTFLLCRRRPRS